MAEFYPHSYHHFYDTRQSTMIPFNTGPSSAANAEALKFLSLPIKRNAALKSNLHQHPAPAAVSHMVKAVTAVAKKAMTSTTNNISNNTGNNAENLNAEDIEDGDYRSQAPTFSSVTGIHSSNHSGSPTMASNNNNAQRDSTSSTQGSTVQHLNFRNVLLPVILDSLRSSSSRPGSPLRSSSPTNNRSSTTTNASTFESNGGRKSPFRSMTPAAERMDSSKRTASMTDTLKELNLQDSEDFDEDEADSDKIQFWRTASMLLPTVSQWDALDEMRVHAGAPERSEHGVDKLVDYYGQLLSIEQKFPLQTGKLDIAFNWYEAFSPDKRIITSCIQYEKAAVLYNVAAILAHLGASQRLWEKDGKRLAAAYFQKAAGVLFFIRDSLTQRIQLRLEKNSDLSETSLTAFAQIMLAQSIECFYDKANEERASSAGYVQLITSAHSLAEGANFEKHNQPPIEPQLISPPKRPSTVLVSPAPIEAVLGDLQRFPDMFGAIRNMAVSEDVERVVKFSKDLVEAGKAELKGCMLDIKTKLAAMDIPSPQSGDSQESKQENESLEKLFTENRAQAESLVSKIECYQKDEKDSASILEDAANSSSPQLSSLRTATIQATELAHTRRISLQALQTLYSTEVAQFNPCDWTPERMKDLLPCLSTPTLHLKDSDEESELQRVRALKELEILLGDAKAVNEECENRLEELRLFSDRMAFMREELKTDLNGILPSRRAQLKVVEESVRLIRTKKDEILNKIKLVKSRIDEGSEVRKEEQRSKEIIASFVRTMEHYVNFRESTQKEINECVKLREDSVQILARCLLLPRKSAGNIDVKSTERDPLLSKLPEGLSESSTPDPTLEDILKRQAESLQRTTIEKSPTSQVVALNKTLTASGSVKQLLDSQMLSTAPPVTANLLDTVSKDPSTTEDFLRRLALTQQEEIARLSRLQKDLEREAKNAAKAERRQREEVERLGGLAWKLLNQASQGKYVSSTSLLSEEEALQLEAQMGGKPVIPVRLNSQTEFNTRQNSTGVESPGVSLTNRQPPLSPRRPASMPVRFVGVSETDNPHHETANRDHQASSSSNSPALDTAWNLVANAPEKLRKGFMNLVKKGMEGPAAYGTPNPLLGSAQKTASGVSVDSHANLNNNTALNPFATSPSRKSSYNTAIELDAPPSRQVSGRYLMSNRRVVSSGSAVDPSMWHDAAEGNYTIEDMDNGAIDEEDLDEDERLVTVRLASNEAQSDEPYERYRNELMGGHAGYVLGERNNSWRDDEEQETMNPGLLHHRRRSPHRRQQNPGFDEEMGRPQQTSGLANWVEEQRRISVSPNHGRSHPVGILRKSSGGNLFQDPQHMLMMETAVMMVETPHVVLPAGVLLQQKLSPKRKPVELTKKPSQLSMISKDNADSKKVEVSGEEGDKTKKGRQDSGLGETPSGSDISEVGVMGGVKGRSRRKETSKNEPGSDIARKMKMDNDALVDQLGSLLESNVSAPAAETPNITPSKSAKAHYHSSSSNSRNRRSRR
ncbi:Rhophilin, Rho GTPase binding protein [Chytridiales sp. JEL 0842]|nr:Rhophilin, Rho GTPase binding protein [Chytridiales sp. JEL 0842]